MRDTVLLKPDVRQIRLGKDVRPQLPQRIHGWRVSLEKRAVKRRLSIAVGFAYEPIPQISLGFGGSILVNTDLSFSANAPIATDADILDFFGRLAHPDKQLSIMPGIAHTSLRSKNWRMVYDLVDACCSRADPVHTA